MKKIEYIRISTGTYNNAQLILFITGKDRNAGTCTTMNSGALFVNLVFCNHNHLQYALDFNA